MKHYLMARVVVALAIFFCATGVYLPAHAQSVPLKSTNYSGSITTTGTFQTIQGQTNNRQGCLIQNNGTHAMSVYFGAIASATAATSVQLAAGQAISCAIGGDSVVQDAIGITGTSGDAFFANFQ